MIKLPPLPEPDMSYVIDGPAKYNAQQMREYSDAENAALRAEAETFQMAYRMKCDIETKALHRELEEMRQAHAAELIAWQTTWSNLREQVRVLREATK